MFIKKVRSGDIESKPGPAAIEMKIEQVLQTLKEHTKTLADIKRDQRVLQKEVKDHGGVIKNFEERLYTIQSSIPTIAELQGEISTLSEPIVPLSQTVDDLQYRLRRNNFIRYGIPEKRNQSAGQWCVASCE